RLAAVTACAALTLWRCGSEASNSPVGPTATRPASVLWSADHETGDLSQWYISGGGGEFNSGAASATASSEVAHSGRYSAKASILTPGVSAVRLFRWNES